MTAETLRTFARCRAAALAAMLDAGGQLAYVAATAPAAAPAAAAATGPLTAEEIASLAHCPPRLLASISRALSHLPSVPAASAAVGMLPR